MEILGEMGLEEDSSAECITEEEDQEEEMSMMSDSFSAVRLLLLRKDGTHRTIVRSCPGVRVRRAGRLCWGYAATQ